MSAPDDAAYRVQLAEGFAIEAREDLGLRRWRSCVDNSQLCVENAAKVALELLGPAGRTHAPGAILRQELAANRFRQEVRAGVERLAECAELLGWEVHVQSDYGDEARRQTPWDLFDESQAQQALALAEEALQLARHLMQTGP